MFQPMSAFVSLPKAAKEAADRGDLLAAIQLTQEMMGVNQNDAQQAVNAYVRGASTPITSGLPGQVPASRGFKGASANADWNGSSLPPQAIAALQRGNMIEAIKHTRGGANMGLKETRDTVMTFLERNPHIKQQFQTAAGNKSINLTPFLATLVALVVAGVAAAVFLLSSGS